MDLTKVQLFELMHKHAEIERLNRDFRRVTKMN
jgi:hypothetical protein